MSIDTGLIDDRSALKRATGRSRREIEFLPAALEILEQPPSPTLRLTTAVLVMSLVTAISWASLAKIDVVSVAEGRVIPTNQVKLVQPLEPGVVRIIHVAEGDTVRAGQLLIEIDPTDQTADLEQARYDRLQAALDAESARVQLSGLLDTPFVKPEGADPAIADAVSTQTHDMMAKHLAELASLDSQIREQQAAKAAQEAQVSHNGKTRPVLDERYSALKKLNDQHLAQAPNWEKARQDVIDSDSEWTELQQKLVQSDSGIGTLKAKRDETEAAYRADASDRRLKALQKVFGLDQVIAKESMHRDKRHLTAPVDGTVLGLKTNTVGGVVAAADALMTIVPSGGTLEVEAVLASKDIGYVQEGQPVEIKLETFPFTRYGTISGRVRRIGRDSLRQGGGAASAVAGGPVANETGAAGGVGAGDLAFPIRVALDRTTISVNGKDMPVVPGMKVTAEIKTDQRRVAGYLLDEVFGHLWTAGRER